jgi:hypothetical protein
VCIAVTAKTRVGWQAAQIVVVVELAKKVMKLLCYGDVDGGRRENPRQETLEGVLDFVFSECRLVWGFLRWENGR